MPGNPEKISSQEFHLEEYKSLRSEILAQGAKYDQMKLITIGGLGALYSWMFSNLVVLDRQTSCVKLDLLTVAIMLVIPVWISLVVGSFAVFILNWFEKGGTYLRLLELYLGERDLSWEKFAFARDINAPIKKYNILTSRDRLWLQIIISCVVASLGFYIHTATLPLCAYDASPVPPSPQTRL